MENEFYFNKTNLLEKKYTMKTTRTNYRLITSLVIFLFCFLPFITLQAQDEDCELTEDNGYGYSTTIKEVVDLGGGSYNITLSIFFDGCPGPGCKNVSYIAFEALPGTYSNVSATATVSGNTFSPSINLGPRNWRSFFPGNENFRTW